MTAGTGNFVLGDLVKVNNFVSATTKFYTFFKLVFHFVFPLNNIGNMHINIPYLN